MDFAHMAERDHMVEDGITIHLIERIKMAASSVKGRDLGRDAVKAALRELANDEDLAVILKNPDRVREWDDVKKVYVHRDAVGPASGSQSERQAVMVGPIRKLEWHCSMSGVHTAETAIGLWYVEPRSGKYAAYSPFAVLALGNGMLEAAKSACEDDYAARLKACVLGGILDA